MNNGEVRDTPVILAKPQACGKRSPRGSHLIFGQFAHDAYAFPRRQLALLARNDDLQPPVELRGEFARLLLVSIVCRLSPKPAPPARLALLRLRPFFGQHKFEHSGDKTPLRMARIERRLRGGGGKYVGQ